jgi:hypothetical protein
MNLYIQIKNNQPVNHPAYEDNLIQAFGAIPAEWEPFIRVERPIPTTYQVLESDEPVYTKVNGVWTDVWSTREMTAEEKTAKQQSVIGLFNSRDQAENWSAWTLDEETCVMKPPIPRGEKVEGILVYWCGAESNWKEAPTKPEGNYKFNFSAWQWVAL